MIRLVATAEQVMAEASAWLVRLQRDPVTEVDGLEFDAWLEAAATHRAAYAEAVALWHEFATCGNEIADELAAAQAPQPAPSPKVSRRWVAGGAGGLAIAAGLAVAVLPTLMSQPAAQTYITGKGQHQTIRLADGSTVDLNAETRLSVTMGKAERKIVLGDGEAIFDVAHDSARPFTVQAADHIVRDVGTQFDVRSRQGDLTITVARGEVEIRPAGASQGRPVRLTPGQRLEIAQTGVEHLQAVNPQEALSWRAGRLVYRDQPLADVVADLNRQFVEQIDIADPDLAKTPITGVVVLDDPHSVIARLSLMLPIRSVPSQRGLLLLRK
jgi:transmembrane sensor